MEIINQNVEKFNTALRVDNKGLFSCLEIDVENEDAKATIINNVSGDVKVIKIPKDISPNVPLDLKIQYLGDETNDYLKTISKDIFNEVDRFYHLRLLTNGMTNFNVQPLR